MTQCPDCQEPLVACEVEEAGAPLRIWPSATARAGSSFRRSPRTGLKWERQTAFSSWLSGQACPRCGLLLVRVADPACLAGPGQPGG
jgi:hypothetical protein